MAEHKTGYAFKRAGVVCESSCSIHYDFASMNTLGINSIMIGHSFSPTSFLICDMLLGRCKAL